MLRKLKTFQALPSEQKRLFLQAYRLLGTMRFAILTRKFKSLVSGLELHREAYEQQPLTEEDLATAHQIGWAVRKAAQFTPWQSTCLVQVLAAQHMLYQRGIAGAFYLGATNAGKSEQQQTLSAHAWLKCNRDFITGEPGHEQFTVVSTFSWL
ncbi:MAG: lasso peptide biosynthesis B2 protein [Gammaproteobacteria bacterium]|nr:MAG: lasso peptide biosynthesis B2 protein [Gammaproteobacteria bacterium]